MDEITATERATKNSALIVASFGSFITPFMASSVNVALPAIDTEFQMGAVLLSWIPTIYLLASTVSLVPIGKLADIYGRKKILTLGVVLLTLSSLLLVVCTSVRVFLLLRFLQGVGSSMVFATGVAIVSSVFPPRERGRAMGITVAVVYLGQSLGPFVGGLLTEQFSWRSIFLAVVPFGLANVALIRWKLKGEWADAKGESIDYLGSVVYAIAVVAIMVGVSAVPKMASLWAIGIGVLFFFGFVKWEMKARMPIFEIRLFTGNRAFSMSCVAALISYSATFAVGFLLSLYLQYIKGLGPQSAGVVLIAQPVVMTVFSPFAGRLSDKLEPRVVASVGMGLTTIALALLIFLNEDASLMFVIASLVLLGSGLALFSSPNMSAIMSSVEPRFYGLASGSVGTMRLLGQMLSMGISASIFAFFLGGSRISPEVVPSFLVAVKYAFIVFTVLCLVGIPASLARGKLRSNE